LFRRKFRNSLDRESGEDQVAAGCGADPTTGLTNVPLCK
jgi:hypothetical protein